MLHCLRKNSTSLKCTKENVETYLNFSFSDAGQKCWVDHKRNSTRDGFITILFERINNWRRTNKFKQIRPE